MIESVGGMIPLPNGSFVRGSAVQSIKVLERELSDNPDVFFKDRVIVTLETRSMMGNETHCVDFETQEEARQFALDLAALTEEKAE